MMKCSMPVLLLLGVLLMISCAQQIDKKTVESSTKNTDTLVEVPNVKVEKLLLYYNNKTSLWTLNDQLYSGYAEEKGILSHKWHLVIGTQQAIYKLGRKDYFVEENLGLTKEEDEFLHTENFVLIDKNRQTWSK